SLYIFPDNRVCAVFRIHWFFNVKRYRCGSATFRMANGVRDVVYAVEAGVRYIEPTFIRNELDGSEAGSGIGNSHFNFYAVVHKRVEADTVRAPRIVHIYIVRVKLDHEIRHRNGVPKVIVIAALKTER